MSDPSFHERIAAEWWERAAELADWTMNRLVNRTDVWGRYLKKRNRTNRAGEKNNAITAPFAAERGKVFLKISSLEKHFKARDGGGVLGIHAQVHDPAAHDGGSNAAQVESSGPAVGVELVMRQRGIQAVFR